MMTTPGDPVPPTAPRLIPLFQSPSPAPPFVPPPPPPPPPPARVTEVSDMEAAALPPGLPEFLILPPLPPLPGLTILGQSGYPSHGIGIWPPPPPPPPTPPPPGSVPASPPCPPAEAEPAPPSEAPPQLQPVWILSTLPFPP